jgi:hypothetical protein
MPSMAAWEIFLMARAAAIATGTMVSVGMNTKKIDCIELPPF